MKQGKSSEETFASLCSKPRQWKDKALTYPMASLLWHLAEEQEGTKQGPALKGKLELIIISVHLIRPHFSWVRNPNFFAIRDLSSPLDLHRHFLVAWTRKQNKKKKSIFISHLKCCPNALKFYFLLKKNNFQSTATHQINLLNESCGRTWVWTWGLYLSQ